MPADVISPRVYTTQQTSFIRFAVNYNSLNISNFLHLGTMPLGAFIVGVHVSVNTAFNAGTTNTLTVGTTFANANELVAAGDITATTVGYTGPTRGRGMALTMTPGAMEPAGGTFVDTVEGGVGIYAKFVQAGTAATAGQAIVVIEFAPQADR